MLTACCLGASAQQAKTGSGKRLRTIGVVLTAAGAALTGGGAAIYLKTSADARRRRAMGNAPGEPYGLIIGGAGVVGGAVLMGIGIPMWIKGGKRLRQYSSRLQWQIGSHTAVVYYRF